MIAPNFVFQSLTVPLILLYAARAQTEIALFIIVKDFRVNPPKVVTSWNFHMKVGHDDQINPLRKILRNMFQLQRWFFSKKCTCRLVMSNSVPKNRNLARQRALFTVDPNRDEK